MVVQIQTEDDPPHLVSIIKGMSSVTWLFKQAKVYSVPASDGDPSGWHIFNDFLVRPIGEDEALSFPATWKASQKTCLRSQMLIRSCRFRQYFTTSGLTLRKSSTTACYRSDRIIQS